MASPHSSQTASHEGTCPYCRERIHPEAVKCRHCLSDLRSAGPISSFEPSRAISALARLIGEVPDLRKGLRTPEEITAEEAAPIITRLTQTFTKQIDPRTHRTSFSVQGPTLVIDGGASGVLKSGLLERGAGARLAQRLSSLLEEIENNLSEPESPRGSIAGTHLTAEEAARVEGFILLVRYALTDINGNLEALAAEMREEKR